MAGHKLTVFFFFFFRAFSLSIGAFVLTIGLDNSSKGALYREFADVIGMLMTSKSTNIHHTIPTGKIHAHSCVLRPEFQIQYIYTYVKNRSTINFELDTQLAFFCSQEFLLQQIRIHIREQNLS